MKNQSGLFFIQKTGLMFAFAMLVASGVFAAPAENAMRDLNELNKIKRMQDQINLVRTYPQPAMRIQRLSTIAKLSALPKLPAVSRVPSYSGVSSLSKIIAAKKTGTGKVQNGMAQLRSAEKVIVLPALPKEKPSKNKNWFELAFKPRETKSR